MAQLADGATNPNDVFINCRFDTDWNAQFEALVFAVISAGFRVRCAREIEDATGTRLDKLYQIIGECRFGIHDLSCVELDAVNKLPRFNMPLELGFFLAAKRYGGDGQKDKRCIIFDAEPYRYQMFISDLSGLDFTPHNDDIETMITAVRNFLHSTSKRKSIPTARTMCQSYRAFCIARPDLVAAANLGHGALQFSDYENLVIEWVAADKQLSP
jgi:hypothetical protein